MNGCEEFKLRLIFEVKHNMTSFFCLKNKSNSKFKT